MPDQSNGVESVGMLAVFAGWLLLATLPVACDAPTARLSEFETSGAAKSLDSGKFERPMFNGVALHTGPHVTPKEMKGLTIRGYNYTDTYIDRFAVNGAGGGNLEVSRKHAGGGGGTCCALVPGGLGLPMTVDISWKRDGDGPYCKQTVLLDGPIPDDPYGFDVHFYQDGTIQVAIAPFDSEALVKLDRFNAYERKASGNVNNDGKLSKCEP
jgi:hypothetical protein